MGKWQCYVVIILGVLSTILINLWRLGSSSTSFHARKPGSEHPKLSMLPLNPQLALAVLFKEKPLTFFIMTLIWILTFTRPMYLPKMLPLQGLGEESKALGSDMWGYNPSMWVAGDDGLEASCFSTGVSRPAWATWGFTVSKHKDKKVLGLVSDQTLRCLEHLPSCGNCAKLEHQQHSPQGEGEGNTWANQGKAFGGK